MKRAKAIMVQGTGSGVGKSIVTSALCRIFFQDGFTVAPFKSQNMALNSFVTEDGGEIGRAQATQAMACKIRPSIHMNPILIKPTSNTGAQIIVHGKPVNNMSVYQYKKYKKTAFKKVRESYDVLAVENDVIVIEGAGSPAEINLKSHDLVNMRVSKMASAPVILVGDIDKGGVFAWLIGTLELLTKEERKRVKGFIINKFRGDRRLLRSGLTFLEKRTGIKVLGVLPYYKDIVIPEEDCLPEEERRSKKTSTKKIKISIIRLPHMSNFDDFDALEKECDVSMQYVDKADNLDGADVIIIPGTKNTIEDLRLIRRAGFEKKIQAILAKKKKVRIVGICGGYQMMGEKISDAHHIETKSKSIKGLGILPVSTELCREKTLSQVKAKDLFYGCSITGYEIHHGTTKLLKNAEPVFMRTQFMNKRVKRSDGVSIKNRKCWGSYIHGIFNNDQFRGKFLNDVRKQKGWAPIARSVKHDVDSEIDKLSVLFRENLDMKLLYKILNKTDK